MCCKTNQERINNNLQPIKTIGGAYVKKNGPENATLSQLAQAESEGVWAEPEESGFFCDAPVILLDFIKAKAVKVLRQHMETALYYRQLPADSEGYKLDEDINLKPSELRY